MAPSRLVYWLLCFVVANAYIKISFLRCHMLLFHFFGFRQIFFLLCITRWLKSGAVEHCQKLICGSGIKNLRCIAGIMCCTQLWGSARHKQYLQTFLNLQCCKKVPILVFLWHQFWAIPKRGRERHPQPNVVYWRVQFMNALQKAKSLEPVWFLCFALI